MGKIVKHLSLVSSKGRASVPVLFDTGAAFSVLRPDVALKIGVPQKLVRTFKFKGVDGKRTVRTSSALLVSVVVNGKVLNGALYVSPDLKREAVIGVDFMQAWDIHLHPKAHRFTVGNDPDNLEL